MGELLAGQDMVRFSRWLAGCVLNDVRAQCAEEVIGKSPARGRQGPCGWQAISAVKLKAGSSVGQV